MYMNKFISTLFTVLISLSVSAQSFFVNKTSNEIILNKTYITIGYNTQYKIPNYVGEKLTHNMVIGSEKREPGFYPENLLPVKYQTRSNQYKNSGYDRGHLAPAADFKWNKQTMYDSFSMANVAPQWPTVNRGKWQKLEEQVRSYTNYVDTLYVITGTVVTNPNHKISNDIVVPSYFYKAVIGKKGNRYKVSCAWLFNNDMSLVSKQMTINELERFIGRNLFYKKNNESVEGKILLPY